MAICLETLAKERRNNAHSIFSPSGSKMWMGCAGSLIPNLLTDDTAGEEAAEGTVAHDLAETCLKKGLKAGKRRIGEVVNQEGWDIEITEDMYAHVRDYVDYCNELEGDHYTEQRVDFSDLTPIPEQTGTADHLNMRWQHLDVTDLKFGRGVPVFAEDNTQAIIYGYGAFQEWDWLYNFQTITLRICQPRLDYWGEVTLTRDELMMWAGRIKERARLAWRLDAPRSPSPEACMWCRVQDTCPAKARMIEQLADDTFEDYTEYDNTELRDINTELEDDLMGDWFDPSDPPDLSNESLERILKYRKTVEKFFNGVYDTLLSRAVSDDLKLNIFKVVESRSRRAFLPSEKFVKAGLVRGGLPPSMCYQTDFISPAEAERRLRAKAGIKLKDAKKVVNSLTVMPPGKKALALINDKRDDLGNDADVFEDYTLDAD